MINVSKISQMRGEVKRWKLEGNTVAFVATMGNLHAGHIALVVRAQELADKVVVSIFVNPIQFDKEQDLQAYPRTLDDDRSKLSDVGCDLVFTPSVEEFYPEGDEITRVEVPIISELLEGASRPGHFSGVSTVVNKLFNIISPDVAIFGEKDFQQLMLIRKMVVDLNMPIEVIGLPTVREPDGLAMSSRNGYLTIEERQQAPVFYNELRELAKTLREGVNDFQILQQSAIIKLDAVGFKSDYIEVRRVKDLKVAEKEDRELVVLGSAWLGKARLIDNVVISI